MEPVIISPDPKLAGPPEPTDQPSANPGQLTTSVATSASIVTTLPVVAMPAVATAYDKPPAPPAPVQPEVISSAMPVGQPEPTTPVTTAVTTSNPSVTIINTKKSNKKLLGLLGIVILVIGAAAYY